jgi:iduronate 2-sulfatase
MRPVSRREFLAGATAAASAAALGMGCSSHDGDDRLNVLYVSADDLGTTLGAYGSDQVASPYIDAFASRSVVFERCHCQIAICSSSRTSILAGVRPERSGLIALDHDWQAAMPGAQSLPRLFRDQGYQTTSIGKIFDPRGGGPDDCWDDQVSEWGVEDSTVAIEKLKHLAAGDGPFFLAVGYTQPHCPWDPAAEAMAAYDVDSIELLGPGRTFAGGMQECAGANAQEVTDAEAREITARYFGEITEIDRAFGELLASVDELGLFDNTIVIFWSGDHGFHLGQNGRWGKWSCYDAATRVPLMMWVPGMTTSGQRTAGIVECIDMYPTLVDLCGLDLPPQVLDGLSFAPLLEAPTMDWKHSAFSVWGLKEVGVWSVTTAQYNYIESVGNLLQAPTFELYDLIADPRETVDLFTTRPEIAEVMAERLQLGPDAALPDAPPIAW